MSSYNFFVDYNIIDTNNIIDIDRYLTKKIYLNLCAFDIIAGINESKILTKHIS